MKKIIGKICVASALLGAMSLHADAQPYASIQNLPSTPYFVLDSYIYFNLINTHSAEIVVDVDSQDGGVARFVAQQAANLPSVKQIYSVNPWKCLDPSQKHAYQRFLSNVKQENTTEMIIPLRMTSQEGAESLHVLADFISLVGNNDQNGIYNDIQVWYPRLSDTGVMCGNNWNDNAVQAGVTKAALALDLNVKINGNVWYFEKGQ